MKNHENKLAEEEILFTSRELQIAAYLILSTFHWEIARFLNTSQNTVETQIKHLRQKVGARNCAGFVTYALNHGFKLNENTGNVFYKNKLIELPK